LHDDQRSDPERAAHYRKMALDALLRAEMADEAGQEWQRESYLQLARSWHALATHLEEPIKGPRDGESQRSRPESRIT
jgi:hypothetical protein